MPLFFRWAEERAWTVCFTRTVSRAPLSFVSFMCLLDCVTQRRRVKLSRRASEEVELCRGG